MLPQGHQHKGEVNKGDLLLSNPFLNDPNFERTVILICENDESGHVGLVVNKPITDVVLGDIMQDLPERTNELFVGGPVDRNLLQFIHTNEQTLSHSLLIKNDLHWGGDFDELKSLIRIDLIDDAKIRFFLGYSGWAPEQLGNELEEDSWIVNQNFNLNKLLSIPPDNMWEEILRSMGEHYKMLSNFPLDPRLN